MLDVKKFFQATNPGNTLFINNPEEDKKYYIDFSSVRGGQIIEDLKDKIAHPIFGSPDEPTCQLFTGHIGCGKSTELLRLKADLEQEGFHVVYFDSFEELELGDVDVSDILLAIARRVSESLEESGISLRSGYFKNLFAEIKDRFQISTNIEAKLSLGIAEITAETKASPTLREKLRGYIEPQTRELIKGINKELLEPAIEKLKQQHKKGLVAIVDNLEKLDIALKPWGRSQHEYLFVDRAEQLRTLNCHVVYTMPLALRFSNDFDTLTQKFRADPKVLPMVPVKFANGSECAEGIKQLRQMVLARAFPDMDKKERLDKITEIFDSPETLDCLCKYSGGHVRNLLRFLNDSIRKQRGLPISRQTLEEVIRAYRNERILAVDDREWGLLSKVIKEKKVGGDEGYKTLIRSMFVYEYHYKDELWFDINPILAEAKELK